MLSTKIKYAVLLLLLGNTVWAETLIEKEKNGRDLTAIELTAIFMAEIKDCENKVPEFKSQVDKYVANFKNQPKYKEIERSPEFARLAAEASYFVLDRRHGSDIRNTCKNTLTHLQNQKF
jgi:hypothetical protein